MKHISTAAITAALLLASTGCKKDTTDPPVATPVNTITATVRMHYMFMNGTEAFALNGTVLHDSLGHAVQLDTVRFFVSGVHAMDDADDAIGHYEGVYLLVDAAQASNDFLLGQIHSSHLHQFHFNLGLDPTANAGDPDTAAPPLNDASMFFTGASAGMGYKFLAVTGHADLDANGTYETTVRYECGMNMAFTEAHAHVHHDLADGDTYTAHIGVDLMGIFAGLNIAIAPTPNMHAPECTRMMLNLSAGIDGME